MSACCLIPKNEGWIAVSFSSNYTVHDPIYFARREAECLRQRKNGGWNVRLVCSLAS